MLDCTEANIPPLYSPICTSTFQHRYRSCDHPSRCTFASRLYLHSGPLLDSFIRILRYGFHYKTLSVRSFDCWHSINTQQPSWTVQLNNQSNLYDARRNRDNMGSARFAGQVCTSWRCCLAREFSEPIKIRAQAYISFPTCRCNFWSTTPVRRLQLVFLCSISSKSMLAGVRMAEKSHPSRVKAAAGAARDEETVSTRSSGLTFSVFLTICNIQRTF
jgi:hypothetical protein